MAAPQAGQATAVPANSSLSSYERPQRQEIETGMKIGRSAG
jgi:hypothetical protein